MNKSKKSFPNCLLQNAFKEETNQVHQEWKIHPQYHHPNPTMQDNSPLLEEGSPSLWTRKENFFIWMILVLGEIEKKKCYSKPKIAYSWLNKAIEITRDEVNYLVINYLAHRSCSMAFWKFTPIRRKNQRNMRKSRHGEA